MDCQKKCNSAELHSNRRYKKSSPIPTWKPRMDPSVLLATSGTPKLTSTRTDGSKRYTSPTPADTDGLDMQSSMLS